MRLWHTMCLSPHVLYMEKAMKIAIPVFHNRVSPVFDWSSRILVIESDGSREISREERSTTGTTPVMRVEYLVEMNVDTLLCGGISETMLAHVLARGINVIPWVTGDAEEVFSGFLDGRVPGKDFTMPGCPRRRRGRGFRGPRPMGHCRGRERGPGGKHNR